MMPTRKPPARHPAVSCWCDAFKFASKDAKINQEDQVPIDVMSCEHAGEDLFAYARVDDQLQTA